MAAICRLALTAHLRVLLLHTPWGGLLTNKRKGKRVGMEQQISEAPQVRRRGGRPSYPDWTEEQMDILRQIQAMSAGQTQVRWAKVFSEHPEWKGMLLSGGRPLSHLWHVSRNITSGRAILPRPGMSKQRIPAVARRGSRRKKVIAWWKVKGVPHPVAAAAARRRAANGMEALPKPASVITDRINYCPGCGSPLAHYRRADGVLEAMKNA